MPEKAPCTDRDPGLKQVVAGAERIAVGVEEDLEPPALITVQHKWNQRDGDDGCDREGGELSGSSLPREEHPQQNGHEHDGGAEVRLGQDQRGRSYRQHQHQPKCPPRQSRRAAKQPGEHQHEQEL